ncbi:hypothetical protein [Parasitella parasitica]|uniref:Uncharacterized protein n=1 Tax=Parasitella parasitica TaxID=35722 RepID=A0A0B7MX72_9FUNG|nr:hypothetical protein [Parasitella parasitica]
MFKVSRAKGDNVVFWERKYFTKFGQDKQKEANQEETSVGTSNKRKGGRKVKDSPEKKKDKASERKRRKLESSPSTSVPVVCKSCGQTGHSSARSHDCPNHGFTLAERLCRDLSKSHQRYTVSLPHESFLISEDDQNRLMQYQQTITRLSSFMREVIYKAQVFINYSILHSGDSLTNDIFEQNYRITIDVVENKYPRLANITGHKLYVYSRTNHKSQFAEGDATRMPLVVFGDSLKGRSHVKFKGHRVGVSEIIYKQLKTREKLGEVLVRHKRV